MPPVPLRRFVVDAARVVVFLVAVLGVLTPDVVKDIAGGLRSSMSYCNATNIEQFVSNVKFGRKR
jgi:IMP dehydrogenase/GMP reductase